MKPETTAVHAGFESESATGAVMPPVYFTSTYAQRAPGETTGYEYSRTDNPTRTPLQAALAELEGGKHGLVFGSGLSAIDAVLNTLKSGDHVVAGNDLYGGTYRLFEKVAKNRGIQFSYSALQSEEELRSLIRPNTKWIWAESPTNPMLRLVDIQKIAKVAHESGVKLGIDNTFMSPMLQNPLSLGADLVMHSITKYINGHSDVVMGGLVTNDDDLYQQLKFLQNSVGAVPGPMDCFLVLRGIRTLAVRMKQHTVGAMTVAEFLEKHPKVESVIYPGLQSHPDHELAKRQASGFGGMISFYLKGGIEESKTFLGALKLFKTAESLGGVESLIEHPAIMTHASLPEENRKQLGILDNFIRISVGIEHGDDLCADLDQALAKI